MFAELKARLQPPIFLAGLFLGFALFPAIVFAQEQGAPGAAASPTPSPAPNDGQTMVVNGGSGNAPQVPELFSGLFDSFDYDPRGRRDPFSQNIIGKPVVQGELYGPLLPLQKFDLEQLRLTGIIWNVRQPKAILKDPNGQIHVVTTNSKIGSRNGYVAVIREGEIVVVETIEQDGRLVSTAQVVKIAK